MVGAGAAPVALPVGSVVFSVRQLSEKAPVAKAKCPQKTSFVKSRSVQHRSAFAEISELFSSSPSRISSSAIALNEADSERQVAMSGVKQSQSHSEDAAAALQHGAYGIQEDSDESSGQIPIGVLEALMVRPASTVEQDTRVLQLALKTQNQ